jgi:hypothetical protein
LEFVQSIIFFINESEDNVVNVRPVSPDEPEKKPKIAKFEEEKKPFFKGLFGKKKFKKTNKAILDDSISNNDDEDSI